MDNQQGPTVQHMEFCSLLYASLDVRVIEGERIHVYVWLSPFHCSPETTTTLLGYTPIQNKKFKV